ncbi:MAG: hypothetical protein K6A44_00795 [bacterium]|nr:hypothetical protein [bacterium]
MNIIKSGEIMTKDKFFNFNKKEENKKELNPKNWGLNIQKREYQDIVISHQNRPEDMWKNK